MATNYHQHGQTVDWTNGTGSNVASGDPVVIGTQLGVAITDIANGESGTVAMEGVFSIPKATGSAINQGTAVDFDVSEGNANGSLTPATGDLTGCGIAWATAAWPGAERADATVMVKLNASAASVTA